MDYNELDDYIKTLPERKGTLISVLHKAQELYGYLPRELMLHIAQEMAIPASKVFGVVTFYSLFKNEIPAKHSISICLGTACFVRGAEEVLRKFQDELGITAGEASDDGLFSLESVRCVGACGLAPVVRVDDRIYGRVKTDDVGGIIDECMAGATEGILNGKT